MLSVHSKPNDPNRIVDSQNQRQSERWDQNSAYQNLIGTDTSAEAAEARRMIDEMLIGKPPSAVIRP
jgi:hypothetical protein